jgi:hypothetical protein
MRAIALFLLQHYPVAWRERYAAEVSALIEESRLRFPDLCELLRGLLSERARELLLSDEKPRRTAVALSFLRLIAAAFFLAAVFSTGSVLRRVLGPWPESVQDFSSWLLVALLLAFFAVLARTRTRPWYGPHPPYPAWVAVTLLPAFFLLMTMLVWSGLFAPAESRVLPAWMSDLSYAYYWGVVGWVAQGLCAGLMPGRQLLFEFSHLAGVEEQLKIAQRLVDGCHEWIARGVPSPLAQADAEVARWTRERDAIRERLHAMGYRARFGQAKLEEN